MKIAIDGPSGAGKSTIAKILAAKMNMVYIDTGAMYRALALKVYRLGIAVTDESAIGAILPYTDVKIRYNDGVMEVYLDNENVSSEIRQHHVSKYASDVSKLATVRKRLVEMQQELAAKGDSVLDGRDIGTVVLPDADYKFFLTADVEIRARRRYDELTAKGSNISYEEVHRDIIDRDYNDTHRSNSPLIQAHDCIVVDSSDMSIDEVVRFMSDIIKEKK